MKTITQYDAVNRSKEIYNETIDVKDFLIIDISVNFIIGSMDNYFSALIWMVKINTQNDNMDCVIQYL